MVEVILLMGVKFYKVCTSRIGWVVLVGVILLMGFSFIKCVNRMGGGIATNPYIYIHT